MKSRKGMTLIEVVVSLAIIGLVATTMLGVFNTGLINIVKSGLKTNATLESEAILNSGSYSDVNSFDIDVEILDSDGNLSTMIIPITEYNAPVEIESGLAGNVSVNIKGYRYDPDE